MHRLDFTSSGALEQGVWSLLSSLVGCRVRQHEEGDKVWHQLILCTPGSSMGLLAKSSHRIITALT